MPTKICAWCKKVIRRGDKEVTHGACDECRARVKEDHDVEIQAKAMGVKAKISDVEFDDQEPISDGNEE